jgi:hypothetical protein
MGKMTLDSHLALRFFLLAKSQLRPASSSTSQSFVDFARSLNVYIRHDRWFEATASSCLMMPLGPSLEKLFKEVYIQAKRKQLCSTQYDIHHPPNDTDIRRL